MPRPLLTTALVAALACTSATARADLFEIAWDAHGRFARDLTIVPGGFVELCGLLQSNQTVQWRFDASAPTDFNIHYHEGPKVVTPTQQRGARKAQGRLAVKSAQDHCWMWSHKGAKEATLRVELRR